LAVYTFIGIFSINFLLYATYYYFAADLPKSEIILLGRGIGGDPFPNYGFALSIIPAAIALFVCIVSTKIHGIYQRCLTNIVGVSIASFVSATFLPVSIPSSLSYLIFNAIVAIITIVRHPSFASTMIPKFVENADEKRLSIALQLAHNRLSLLVRETIWIVVTIAIGAATVHFVYLSNIAGPIMSSIPSLRNFYQLQTLFFGGFLLYVGGGLLGSTSFMLYQEMISLENLLLERPTRLNRNTNRNEQA